ncbi:Binding-protein-dependent transport systems inner membrane component [metagenome]|uniref:Binding-protein-dependent transport systems inner membrane component n=1 Tax=metagenome TaxID=256318 RepID=A0A2P2C9K8_9ZZZZ
MAERETRPPGTRFLWPTLAMPGIAWLAVLFVAPLYVVLAILFGATDPILRQPVPVWNPLQWDFTQFRYVIDHIVGPDAFFRPALVRTVVYVGLASFLCLLIAYPVAYYTARFAGRWKGVLLACLIAPFWISYMMRMLAWVNLLQTDGLVNKGLSLGGLFDVHVDWLGGQPTTVVLGLVYGYVPYMILPLFAGLDRAPASVLEAARDLGANRWETFRRVTWPLSRQAVVVSLLLTTLPMLGDYFTNDLLSGSPETSMIGNLINNSVLTPGQTGQAGAFVLLILLVSIVPMVIYVRSTRSGADVAS